MYTFLQKSVPKCSTECWNKYPKVYIRCTKKRTKVQPEVQSKCSYKCTKECRQSVQKCTKKRSKVQHKCWKHVPKSVPKCSKWTVAVLTSPCPAGRPGRPSCSATCVIKVYTVRSLCFLLHFATLLVHSAFTELLVHFRTLFSILSLHFFLHFGALYGTLFLHFSYTFLVHF